MNENDPQTYKDPNQPADISAAHENEGADEMSNPEEDPQTSHVIERSEYDQGADYEQPTEMATDPEETAPVIEAQAEETTSTTAVEPAHPGEGSDVVEAPEATTTTTTESPATTEAIVTVPSQEKPELAETGSDISGGLLVGTTLVLAGITASAKRFFKDRKNPKS